MAISQVNRARVILDMIEDGDVASEAAYGNIDLADVAKLGKYALSLVSVHSGIPLSDVKLYAGAEQAKLYINVLRELHRNALSTLRAGDAANAARLQEINTVAAETEAELGGDDVVVPPV